MGIAEHHNEKWRCILLFRRYSRGYQSLQLLIMRRRFLESRTSIDLQERGRLLFPLYIDYS
ncbi:hypothetical protein H5410_063375 [Solanum commersonii]|uniref:Uncharacterized protein n=1 Tax=Solanum commersonii TaxID=4109 RepID=A0A9J5WD34_SOLCO|nr:hypothetical protein H5410_063375 [Solanum commersonii]